MRTNELTNGNIKLQILEKVNGKTEITLRLFKGLHWDR